jgi:AraC-like DNA-binding protein
MTEVRNLRFQCSQPALHDHPFHQMFVLTKGGGTHSLDGETVEVQAPVVLVAPKGRRHLYVPSATAEGWSLGFTEDLVPRGGNLLFLNTVPCSGIPLSPPAVAERLRVLAELIHQNHWDPLGPDPMVQSYLLAALLRILERIHQDQPARHRSLPLADRLLTERFLALLDEACRHRWPAARFARELRCSRHKLAAICQQALGLPIHGALEEHRMRQARARLVQGDASIQQIALELGYPDPSYFTKAFRRTLGMTPTDYRNSRLEPGGPALDRSPGSDGNDQ